jgi:hypothetical protein
MTIADKPLCALIARPGINSVDELRGKLLGFHPLAQAQIPWPVPCCADIRSIPMEISRFFLGGGTNRITAMETGAVCRADRGTLQPYAGA